MVMAQRLSLFLEHASNPYVQQLREEVDREALQHGYFVEPFFADDRFLQIKQLYSVIHGEVAQRPRAILVHAGFDGLDRIARAALSRGIDWICLHHRAGDLEALRREFPGRTVALVAPDQREIGRHQARLAERLAPGGRLLYVQGSAQNASTHERLAGFSEFINPQREILGVVDGNWTLEDSQIAVSRWLNVMTASFGRLDAVVAQNDAMAAGTTLALRAAAERLHRPDLAAVPLIGCDGVREAGMKLVDDGQLAATVLLRDIGTYAVRATAERLQGHVAPTEVIVPTHAYPTLESVGHVARQPIRLHAMAEAAA
jgi:ABC-type sugar transport system substrate-binding protein